MEMVYKRLSSERSGRYKLYEQVAQIPLTPALLALVHYPQSMPMASWSVPYNQITEEENSNLDYRWVCTKCSHHLKVDSCCITGPHRGLSGSKKTLLADRTLSSVFGCSPCLEWEMTRSMNLYLFMNNFQWFGWIIRDLEETVLKVQWQGSLRPRYMNRIWMRKLWRYFCSMWTPTRVSTRKDSFNDRWTKW